MLKILRKIKIIFLNLYNYFFDFLFLETKLKNDVPIYVLQMGKVGSSSIYYSLKKQLKCLVFHSHNISNKHFDFRIRRLNKFIFEEGKNVKIICLTREPISRSISSFFQNFKQYTGVDFKKQNFSEKEIKDFFINCNEPNITINWFDKVIKDKFKINVYDIPFKNGVSFYCNKNISLLILQSELDDKKKQIAIRYFINKSDFFIENYNISEKKGYAKVYKNYISNVRFTKDFAEIMLESQYFSHFYDDDTKKILYERWVE